MSTTVDTAIDVRPFHVEFPDEKLAMLQELAHGQAIAQETLEAFDRPAVGTIETESCGLTSTEG